ncbi:MAG: hypothetical protein ACJ8DE_20090, partial [Microvirga sp.]
MEKLHELRRNRSNNRRYRCGIATLAVNAALILSAPRRRALQRSPYAKLAMCALSADTRVHGP